MWYAWVMNENQEKFNEPETRARVSTIAEKYRLSLVLLFGSQASGKTHKQSDIDIAVLSEKELSLREMGELTLVFVQALKTNDIDLVDLKTAPPLLLKQVAANAVLLYESKPLVFSTFRVYALKRYMEARPLFKLREEALSRFLNYQPV